MELRGVVQVDGLDALAEVVQTGFQRLRNFREQSALGSDKGVAQHSRVSLEAFQSLQNGFIVGPLLKPGRPAQEKIVDRQLR